jgi:putative SOS response-associated peptidase YedK
MAWLHDRMPLTVPRDAWTAWLDPRLEDPQQARDLLDFSPDWIATAVSDQVNSVRNNGPELIEPIAEPAAAAGMGEAEPLF